MHRPKLVPKVRRYLFLLVMLADHCIVRCTARPEDLDGEGGRRSREHTELLVHELELGVLWDEYGLVGDIVVSSAFFPIPSIYHWVMCSGARLQAWALHAVAFLPYLKCQLQIY